uniref:Uncharacterized protein n=1 Tax=Rangifer tarandus platyrhynchus TaxID=3082113 RepID=A0ACB0FBU7_RANTA|nr:unnamed protein product [Rangifer tarandus platyrhynchus]
MDVGDQEMKLVKNPFPRRHRGQEVDLLSELGGLGGLDVTHLATCLARDCRERGDSLVSRHSKLSRAAPFTAYTAALHSHGAPGSGSTSLWALDTSDFEISTTYMVDSQLNTVGCRSQGPEKPRVGQETDCEFIRGARSLRAAEPEIKIWKEKQTDWRPSLEWKFLDAKREATMLLSTEGQAGKQHWPGQDEESSKDARPPPSRIWASAQSLPAAARGTCPSLWPGVDAAGSGSEFPNKLPLARLGYSPAGAENTIRETCSSSLSLNQHQVNPTRSFTTARSRTNTPGDTPATARSAVTFPGAAPAGKPRATTWAPGLPGPAAPPCGPPNSGRFAQTPRKRSEGRERPANSGAAAVRPPRRT